MGRGLLDDDLVLILEQGSDSDDLWSQKAHYNLNYGYQYDLNREMACSAAL